MTDADRRLRHEVERLAARVELQHRHITLLRSRLRDTMARASVLDEAGEARPPAPARPAGGPPPRARAALPDRTIWPSDRNAPPPLTPTPGLANFGLKRAGLKVLGIAVCGLGRIEREAVVDLIDRQQRSSRDFIPVFLTDSTDFEPFRSRGYVFEYLPPPSRRRLRGTDSWPAYAAERLALLRRKWNIAQVVTFGAHEFAPSADGSPSVPLRAPAADAPPRRARIVFYPDYSEWNPYQKLLYGSVAESFDAAPGDISLASAFQTVPGGEPVIFHLHWEDAVYRGATDEGEAALGCRRFVTALKHFVRRGGAFVWTVHNLQPHEPRFAAIHGRLCRTLAGLAHRIHVHSRAARAELRRQCDAAPEKIRVVAHGNYLGLYKATGSRVEARRTLGVAVRGRVLLFFGKVRTYKGIDELVRAFAALDDPHARLIVAGLHHVRPALDGFLETARERISIIDRIVPDQDVPILFRAADFAVLPYRRVLTSGSLLLALSLATPVVAPDFPSLREVVTDGEDAYLFDPADPRGLVGALRRASSTDGMALQAMRRRALATARRFDWQPLGRELSRLFEEAGSCSLR